MRCDHCGGEFREPEGDLCPICGARLPPPGDEERRGPPWEARSSWLDLGAVGATIKACLLDPRRTFSRMRPAGDLGSPLVYGIALGTVSAILDGLWKGILPGSGIPLPEGAMAGQRFMPMIGAAGIMILGPVAAAIGIFLASGIFHVVLMLLGGPKKGFEATLRVVAYGTGSTAPLHIVPGLGPVVATVWSLVIAAIGLREIHGTTTGKAVVAVLAPAFVCLACLAMAFGMAATRFLGMG